MLNFVRSFDMEINDSELMHLERDIFSRLADQGQFYVFHMTKFWSQIKSSGWDAYYGFVITW